MDQKTILSLLEEAQDGYISGEAISQALGVTRVAVWKQITRLRERGYVIEAVTHRGYRLISAPEPLDQKCVQALLEGHPWQDRILVRDCVDSTNNVLKSMAEQGAPHGTVLMADEQSGGRGRQGKGFSSPKGIGLYYSLLLRPNCAPTQVGHVTAMVAVAGCDAVEAVTGLRPGIKWTNDLVLGGKKLSGILTEMSVEWESGSLQYLVTGIGINCNHKEPDFPEEVRPMATSLFLGTGLRVDRCALAAELTKALYRMQSELLTGKARWLEQYKKDCVTLGRPVRLLRNGAERTGTAIGLDENGGLIIRYDSGETGVVYSGEVSVRGLYGYV